MNEFELTVPNLYLYYKSKILVEQKFVKFSKPVL